MLGLDYLTAEVVATGIVGLLLGGNIIKKVLEGYREAKKQMTVTPMVSGMALSWDRDQQERFMHILERIAESNEEQTKCLQELTDRRQDLMQETLNKMMERLDEQSNKKPR